MIRATLRSALLVAAYLLGVAGFIAWVLGDW